MDIDGPDDIITVTDPVCGARLALDQVARQEDYLGWAYYFCSAKCHARFLEAPGKFLPSGNPTVSAARTPDR